MNHQLDTTTLAALVRAKRSSRSLRDVAQEIKTISPATLHRVESEKTPDLPVFLALCEWLDVPPGRLLIDLDNQTPAGAADTGKTIALLLRSDRTLSPAMADALATVVEATYRALARPVN